MIPRFLRRAIFVGTALTAAALGPSAAGGRSEAAMPSFSLTRYTAEQGLPQNSIRSLLQTRDGYLWVGTLGGLARFDGLRFTVFGMSNTPEMLHDAINALAEDRQDGSLWINTGKGLLRYHRHRFERLDEDQGFPQPFGGLWPARQGGLWYSPHPGTLVRLENRVVRTWQLCPQRLPGGGEEIIGHRVLRVWEEEEGSLLVLMYAALLRFTPATGAVDWLGPPGGTDTRCRDVVVLADGSVLLAAREALWRHNGSAWDAIETVAPGDPQCPALLHPSKDGGFWIVWSDQGPPRLARFQASRSEFVDMAGIPDYPVLSFCQDAEGHLWVGTESGLCRLRRKEVEVTARENGLRNDFVRAVTEGPDGTIWLGTAEGVAGLKNGQVTNLPPIGPGPEWGWAEGLLADRRGRLWYGGRRNTVVIFDQGPWSSPAPLNLGESWVRTLYEDRAGRVWAGFDQGVLWLDEAGSVRPLPERLSHPDVRVIHQDRRGDLWFGTYGGGLNRLRDGRITSYMTSLGEYNNQAWCIHEDADGVFWVGTRNGLNRFVPPGVSSPGPPAGPSALAGEGARARGDFYTFTTRQGLVENRINNIQEDDFGHLWLSGLQGIYRVARRDLNDVAAGRQARALVLAFGEADGMLNSQCNGGANQPAGCKDRAGRIWFPTVRGVAVVDPSTIRRNEVPPTVVIEQVRADEVVVYGDGAPSESDGGGPGTRSTLLAGLQTRLPPGRARVIEIHYTANSFAAPKRVRFKYRLEGHDGDWRFDEDNRRVAFYTNLRPGRYTFRVEACNNHGVWSTAPAEFAFVLDPFFWQTWPFFIVIGTATIGLVALVQAYRLRWQRRLLQSEHQEALAEERTRIARDLHDDLGTALTGVALELDVLRREARDGLARSDGLTAAAARIRALAERMRQVVWAVNPRCDTVSSLASFLEQQAGQFLKADGIRCRIEFPEAMPSLPLDGETRHELALGVREALANVVRHAKASELVLGLSVEPDALIVRVADNGLGFNATERAAAGQGLANLHARLQRIGGRCICRSAPGSGTTIELRVPLPRP
ncbi:MAG TPA: two-component regulator propeller domain-containing protein [Verrucomicrobiota bacterium]|nr:two-component regulator propeller domain-containing protein [Verrucomicrobiota bacterium]HNU51713.1 two-component regulator propeller domain-containing protein [Verrucomicrobiota bacterium]